MDTTTVKCASCGQQMPGNAWSCPHCGDLNPDAEADSLLYLSSERAPDGSFFSTPMPPGPFVTPMHPWVFDEGQPNAPDTGSISIQISVVTQPMASAPAYSASTPKELAAPVNRGYEEPHNTSSRRHVQLPPEAQPPASAAQPELYYPAGTRQEVESSPSGRLHDEVLRLRPRDAYYQPEPVVHRPRYGDNSQQRVSLQKPTPTTAGLLELLGYVGLLGVGHIYSGHALRGLVIMAGWWLWFLVAKTLSAISAGRLDPLALSLGVVAPLISGLWVWLDMQAKAPRN
jgi:hypothetical protein